MTTNSEARAILIALAVMASPSSYAKPEASNVVNDCAKNSHRASHDPQEDMKSGIGIWLIWYLGTLVGFGGLLSCLNFIRGRK